MGLTKRSSTAAPKLQTPKRVIRAVRNYVAVESAELTFKKDDFFYVLSTPHDTDRWYEVTNPLSGERGLVPASCFEIMESRQDRINRINRSASTASATGPALAGTTGQLGLASSLPGSPGLFGSSGNMAANAAIYGLQASESGTQRRPSGGSGSHPLAEASSVMTLRVRTTSIQHAQHQRRPSQPFGTSPMQAELHGTALYSFDAANANELTVYEGDELLVVAQSTEDWFIARRMLGGAKTGLVPSSYVELRDAVSGTVISDLHTYLARNHMRLSSALEWERHQRERWASRSTHSSASGGSTYDDDGATPRLSIGGTLPAPSGLHSSRSRAMTASSSTSSIAERSSFRHPHGARHASGASLQHMAGDNFPRFHADEVASVSVPSFICKDGAYLFQISLRFTTGDHRNIYRGYDDVIYCRNQLNESFPKQTSALKLARISMHGSSMGYLNDAIAERRRSEIDEYVGGLLAMPFEVVESAAVQKLFGSRVDSSLDHLHALPDRSQRQTLQGSFSKHTPSLSADSMPDSAFTPASASSADTAVDAHHSGDHSLYSAQKTKTMSCDAKVTAIGGRQLTQKPSMAALSGAMVKVKVKLGDDMVALRLPSELTLNELKARIASKMGSDEAAASITKIIYQVPSGESASLCDDQDWAAALQATNFKPVLTVVQ
ncbi:bud emergence protein 1 [Coemansia sp. RSA 1822]|nr:bud emergence protein 1 [Coemansia sp. RSA 638]KAJ2564676.1 bud emergence protein 1 [Coemansia sp. RSA 1822]